jgi:hypothetical protein
MAPRNVRSRLPNLFIVGAPKCGTTAWVHYLGEHPKIFFAKPKEHCYFALDLPNFRLTRAAADYAEMFAESGDAEIIGEASAMYLFSQSAAEAIRKHDPKAKILIFLREQEEYLPSLHNQFLWEFAEEIEDFETAWRLSGRRPPDLIPAGCLEPRTLDYAAMGRFGEQVQRYLAAFPPEQLFIIDFRDWTADPRGTYLRILDFLGLQDDGRIDFPPINEGMTYRSRTVVRFVVSPPDTIRRWARRVRTFAGPIGKLLERVAWKGVRLLSAPGYKNQIARELRDEIRTCFAEDNRLLEELIRDTFGRGLNGGGSRILRVDSAR